MVLDTSVYEDTLSAYIYDDDKLVTYKWLSKELEVHVNVAKEILREFWEKRQENKDIVATFMLIGKLEDNSIRVEVVKDSNLTTAKEKFVKIDCQHVYSLQKTLPDIELLASAGEGDIRFSGIKCNENFWRTDEEVDSMRYVGNPVNNNKPPPPKSAPPKQTEKPQHTSSKSPKKSDEKKPENVEEKTKNVTEKQDSDKKVSPPADKGKPASKGAKKPVQSTKAGMHNLFGKVKPKPVETEKTKDEKKAKEQEREREKEREREREKEREREREREREKEREKEKEREREKEKENKKSAKTVNKTSNKTKGNKTEKEDRGKKRNRSKENGSAVTKRKRILICDSDTSEDEAKSEEEEPMEVEEQPRVTRKRSPSPPAEKRENGKRMVRKTIDKTYKDEDGFFVTKKEHVYEAVSDNEEEPQEVKKIPKPKAAPEVKGKKKQTNLMSFFKKS